MYIVSLTIQNRETHTVTVLVKECPYLPAVDHWVTAGAQWIDGTGFFIKGYTVESSVEAE